MCWPEWGASTSQLALYVLQNTKIPQDLRLDETAVAQNHPHSELKLWTEGAKTEGELITLVTFSHFFFFTAEISSSNQTKPLQKQVQPGRARIATKLLQPGQKSNSPLTSESPLKCDSISGVMEWGTCPKPWTRNCFAKNLPQGSSLKTSHTVTESQTVVFTQLFIRWCNVCVRVFLHNSSIQWYVIWQQVCKRLWWMIKLEVRWWEWGLGILYIPPNQQW